MRIFVTGGTGVLGRALLPLCAGSGVEVTAPRHADLDLFDAAAVRDAVEGFDGIVHLATRIPPRTANPTANPEAWRENDRLRAETSRFLVDGALEQGVSLYLQASVTFMYPAEGYADESTSLVVPANGPTSMMVAEAETARFTVAGGRGVVLRFGLLWGPGTGNDEPNNRLGATLHVDDAGTALFAALAAPAGIYNVVADNERISNALYKRTTGWVPKH